MTHPLVLDASMITSIVAFSTGYRRDSSTYDVRS